MDKILNFIYDRGKSDKQLNFKGEPNIYHTWFEDQLERPEPFKPEK